MKLGGASRDWARIDAIAAKAEHEGSAAIAADGLEGTAGHRDAQATLAGHIGSGAQVQVNTQVNVDLGAAVRELIAAIRPRHDAAIPPELAIHLDVVPPDDGAIDRLEGILDGQ